MDKQKFYITTPIYYSSGNFHLGHCYTTVICDALARFKRMSGYDVFYLTGTDEHGQKVEQKAEAAGKTPQAFVDELADQIKSLWKLLDISYDKFIRTTDDYHVAAVQKIFKKLYDNGDIYKSEYEGLYCTPCESFWTESQLVDGKCPDCGREVKPMKEESYFFRLSKYQDKLIELYRENPEFIAPKERMNEMVNNFIKPGLKDLCVSRTSFKWGIPVDFDEKHVVYVWVDALTNYITALGYLLEDETLYKKYWPADLHMVGKEIVRFHTIIWPAILMALGEPLPKQVYGHGWLLLGGDKMSKSKGNIADPFLLCDRYGVDAIRYYLLREVPFGSDGAYTAEMLIGRINTDLANNYGNLLSRTIAMIKQYFGGIIPEIGQLNELDNALISAAEGLLSVVTDYMDKLDAPHALDEIFKLLGKANKYVDDTAPWSIAKQGNKERLGTVLYVLAEVLRVATVALQPFLTKTPEKVLDALGADEAHRGFDSIRAFGGLKSGTEVTTIDPIFRRIDVEKELKFVQEYNDKNKVEEKPAQTEAKPSEISIEDFAKVCFKTGKVLAAEKIEKSKKLLKLTVEVGAEIRTIASGIAEHFSAEELVGRQVVVVANLKPAKLCGVTSQGMILCAEDESGKLALVAPDKPFPTGATVR